MLIPARGGSQGIAHKNTRFLNGKRLIGYTIDTARQIAADDAICVSTDDAAIISILEREYNLAVPFQRPAQLATDQSGMYEVITHALQHYEERGLVYDCIILLQPTSPLRTAVHVREAMALYHSDIDLVISVCETSANPYYVLMEEDDRGYLKKSKEGNFPRRQDIPVVYEINGAIYIINTNTLKNEQYRGLSDFPRKVKYVMPRELSLDIDTPLDWKICECLLQMDTL